MRTTCILAGLALVACGGDSSGDGGGDTGAQANRFAEFIFVDQEGFEATGDFTGLPEGDDWDSVAWLTQQVDPANVRDNMVSGEVEDFQDEIPVPQARVELWFDDVVDSTIDGEATSAVDGTKFTKRGSVLRTLSMNRGFFNKIM